MKKIIQITLLMFCFTANYLPVVAQTNNQEVTITGVVSAADDGSPLIGAAVMLKGSQNASITDVNGTFSLKAKPGDILVISFIGYQTQEVTVGSSQTINISLAVQADLLEEVMVIGYGTQKKSHVTGAVSKADGESMSQIPVARADQALIGKLAGVQIVNTNTEPGAAPTIQVRGVTSISATTSPLIVVDGYPIQGDLSTIDMNDVESVEVLKDAASASIYGSRGANGVILVTTKTGGGYGAKPAQFSFNAFKGVKPPFAKEFIQRPQNGLAMLETTLLKWV